MDFEQILRMSNRQKKKLISTAISKVEYEYFEKTQERISKKEKDIAIDFIMFAFSYLRQIYRQFLKFSKIFVAFSAYI